MKGFKYKAPLWTAATPTSPQLGQGAKSGIFSFSCSAHGQSGELRSGARAGDSGGKLWANGFVGKRGGRVIRDRVSPWGGSRMGWASAHVGPTTCTFSLIVSQKTRHEACGCVVSLARALGPSWSCTLFLQLKGGVAPLGHLRAVFHSVVVFVFFPRLINTFTPCGSLTKRW